MSAMDLGEAVRRANFSQDPPLDLSVPPWEAVEVRGMWVLSPPGLANLQLVVSADEVRVVTPTDETLADVIEQLAKGADGDNQHTGGL